MFDESPVPAIERLSSNDREILSQPEVRAVIDGIKPASFEDWHGTIQDLQGIRDYLSSLGIDALVTPRIIMNRSAVAERIENDPELARLAGWKDGDTVDRLAERFEEMSDDPSHDLLRGFLVGFPTSSVLGFHRKEELRRQGVQPNPEAFFDPNFLRRNPGAIVDDESRAILATLSTEYAGLPRLQWESGPDRPTAEAADDLLDKHRENISKLYQRLWNLSKQDADGLAWSKAVYIRDAKGKALFSFGTFGKDGDNAPDVIALQEKARNVYGDI